MFVSFYGCCHLCFYFLGNMTFPPGAVVAVTSGSQFAAYPVGSAAAATYQQAGAPGGAIIGPIIALGKVCFSIWYFKYNYNL